jgi:hypothetical protein
MKKTLKTESNITSMGNLKVLFFNVLSGGEIWFFQIEN